MKRVYEYPPEIRQCRKCHGEGYIINRFGDQVTCYQCDGKGNLKRKLTVIIETEPLKEGEEYGIEA